MSCSDRLTDLIIKRDLVETALGTGKDYIELEIRGRRVRQQASLDVLKYLNREIAKEQAKTSGPARNRIRLVK